MKNIAKYILMCCVFFLCSCDKDETKVVFLGGEAPVLTMDITELDLSGSDQNRKAFTLTWTNPKYKLNTGISSIDVNYLLEIDTFNSNFLNPLRKQISIVNDLSMTILVKEMNDYLLNQLNQQENIKKDFQLRIISSIQGKQTELVSNVINFSAAPSFPPPKVASPSGGNLWLIGDASPAGWSNPMATEYVESQKFTSISPTLFELTIDLPGGGGYKLIQEQGVWATQYHMIDGGTWESGDFEMKDAEPQFKGPAEAGRYKITFDFQLGKFSAIKL